jgi:hypothetical protein
VKKVTGDNDEPMTRDRAISPPLTSVCWRNNPRYRDNGGYMYGGAGRYATAATASAPSYRLQRCLRSGQRCRRFIYPGHGERIYGYGKSPAPRQQQQQQQRHDATPSSSLVPSVEGSTRRGQTNPRRRV